MDEKIEVVFRSEKGTMQELVLDTQTARMLELGLSYFISSVPGPFSQPLVPLRDAIYLALKTIEGVDNG